MKYDRFGFLEQATEFAPSGEQRLPKKGEWFIEVGPVRLGHDSEGVAFKTTSNFHDDGRIYEIVYPVPEGFEYVTERVPRRGDRFIQPSCLGSVSRPLEYETNLGSPNDGERVIVREVKVVPPPVEYDVTVYDGDGVKGAAQPKYCGGGTTVFNSGTSLESQAHALIEGPDYINGRYVVVVETPDESSKHAVFLIEKDPTKKVVDVEEESHFETVVAGF